MIFVFAPFLCVLQSALVDVTVGELRLGTNLILLANSSYLRSLTYLISVGFYLFTLELAINFSFIKNSSSGVRALLLISYLVCPISIVWRICTKPLSSKAK